MNVCNATNFNKFEIENHGDLSAIQFTPGGMYYNGELIPNSKPKMERELDEKRFISAIYMKEYDAINELAKDFYLTRSDEEAERIIYSLCEGGCRYFLGKRESYGKESVEKIWKCLSGIQSKYCDMSKVTIFDGHVTYKGIELEIYQFKDNNVIDIDYNYVIEEDRKSLSCHAFETNETFEIYDFTPDKKPEATSTDTNTWWNYFY